MNIGKRIVTFFQMFAHQMAVLKDGEYHIEELHVEGPEIAGVFIPVKFVSRHCHTCGYLKDSQ